MKKLIALFAVTTMASTSAIAGIALSGSASVTYDDQGASASCNILRCGYDYYWYGWYYDVDGDHMTCTAQIQLLTAVDLSTTIGPVTIAADMFQVDESK